MTDAGRRKLDALRVEELLDDSAPWGGRSSRVLTRAYEQFRLEPLGDDATDFAAQDDALIDQQYRRFLHGS